MESPRSRRAFLGVTALALVACAPARVKTSYTPDERKAVQSIRLLKLTAYMSDPVDRLIVTLVRRAADAAKYTIAEPGQTADAEVDVDRFHVRVDSRSGLMVGVPEGQANALFLKIRILHPVGLLLSIDELINRPYEPALERARIFRILEVDLRRMRGEVVPD